jgi:hypothetical protein
MRSAAILAFFLSTALNVHCAPAVGGCPRLTAAEAATVDSGVRAFVLAVARDVASNGPGAWERAFADSPSFFMAVNGRLVFRDRAAATAAIGNLAGTIRSVDLTWGPDLRVDALTPTLAVVASSYREVRTGTDGSRVDESGFFTALAEHDREGWRFRDAHWSVPTPPPALR